MCYVASACFYCNKIAATNKQRKYKRENNRQKCFLSLVSTKRLKVIKGSKIESRKDDGVNRLVCMLGDKLISHLITFKRQKRRLLLSKKIYVSDSRSKSSDLPLEQLRFFFYWNWKKLLLREDFRSCSIHFCLNKGKVCITHLSKQFTVSNEDEILAEEGKKFSYLYNFHLLLFLEMCTSYVVVV